MDNLEKLGIAVIGCGRNISEARTATIIERKGVRVAFLGYTSLLPGPYQATEQWAGVAPVRVRTYYEPYEYQPGTPPRVVTIPWSEDVEALRDDIRRARQQADIVVMSIHWGVHHAPRLIAMYQPIVAHAAIDAGCDLLLGHHQHILKAIEVYRGKVIFHGLGNFANCRGHHPEQHYLALPNAVEPHPEPYVIDIAPNYDYQSKYFGRLLTGVAKAELTKNGVDRVSFLPAYRDDRLRGRILRRSDEHFNEVCRYVKWASSDFGTQFTVEGDELTVVT